MSFRKIFITLMIFTLLLSSINLTFAEKSGTSLAKIQELDKAAYNFVKHITKEFNVKWNTKTLSKKIPLYNKELNLVAYLLHVVDKNLTHGYFILDAKDGSIVQFAEGESPYQSLLDQYIDYKFSKKLIKKEDIKLIYGGATFYSVAIEDGNGINIYDFGDEMVAAKSTDSLIESSTSNDSIIAPLSTGIEKYLSGVGDYDWYKGCAPTSSANLVHYWGYYKGYPSLVSGMSEQAIIDELAWLMGTNSSGATSMSDIGPAIVEYMNNKGVYYRDYTVYTYPYYSAVKNEINNDRPAVLNMYGDDSYGGDHSVTLAGYYDDVYDWVIIHDTWSSTSKKVYYEYPQNIKYMITIQ